MGTLERLVASQLGADRAAHVLALLEIDPAVAVTTDGKVTRGGLSLALGVCLFDALLGAVPSGAAYVSDRLAAGGRVCFDHGAIRTVRFAEGPTGALPAGHEAFDRILRPLGYEVAGTYPLPRLNMTGRAYCHRDHPEALPQYFVSELHVERFDHGFAEVATRVFGASRDPLGAETRAALDLLGAGENVSFDTATAALPQFLSAFSRQHEVPILADYQALLTRSAEAAWIATEGNSFNHATDRVAQVEQLADEQRALRRPIKDAVEVSANGRVRQTAFRADPVARRFRTPEGVVVKTVPGSFYEFISRDIDPATGRLDLTFDSSNATGIFSMTRAA